MRWLNLATQIITEVDILQIRHKIIQVIILASLVSGSPWGWAGYSLQIFSWGFFLNRIMFGLYSAKVRFFFVASSVRYKSGFVHTSVLHQQVFRSSSTMRRLRRNLRAFPRLVTLLSANYIFSLTWLQGARALWSIKTFRQNWMFGLKVQPDLALW